MTIHQAKEQFDKLNIKYIVLDCYAGKDDTNNVFFNTQILCPFGYTLDNAIFASDVNHWFVLNKERMNEQYFNEVIKHQTSKEFEEEYPLKNLEIKVSNGVFGAGKPFDKRFLIECLNQSYYMSAIDTINYFLAKELINSNITESTNGTNLKDFINNNIEEKNALGLFYKDVLEQENNEEQINQMDAFYQKAFEEENTHKKHLRKMR